LTDRRFARLTLISMRVGRHSTGGNAPRKYNPKKLESLIVAEQTEANTVRRIRIMSTYGADQIQLQIQPGRYRKTILWVHGPGEKGLLCWFNTNGKRVVLDREGEWYYVSEKTTYASCNIIDRLYCSRRERRTWR
jgi:hypothetical protein